MSKFIDKYKGYIKEMLLYPICILKPEASLFTKFVILGLPRSGTTLLVSLLDSHTQISCEGELWAHQLFLPLHYIECRSRLCKKEVFGFKLLITHFETQNISNSNSIIQQLQAAGYRFISLTRRNLYRAALSNIYAGFLGTFHLSKSNFNRIKGPMYVDPQALLQKMDRFDYLAQCQKKALNGISYLELVYEEDLMSESRHQNTVDRICEYLGLQTAPVETNQLRVTSDSIDDFFTNVKEIEELLRMTKYERYL
jgi:LPS sulfotransferase NodH